MIFCYQNYSNSQSISQKSNTQIADSLDLKGKYVASLKYRTLALKEANHTLNYQKYIQASWHYTKSCIYEAKGGQNNHSLALEHSLKARKIYTTNSSIWFKHKIANRIYHQYGYTQDWKMALIEAQKNLEILNDSLQQNDYKVLIINDDLGFINTKIGDYPTALKYYENVKQIYLTRYPENKRDLAMNYSVMATNYKILGMRKKELSTLLEVEKLWNQIPKNDNFPLFGCYKKLSYWYIYYGNYELAEFYLNKQASLIDSIKHKKTEFKSQRRDNYLNLYKNYIELNFKKKDYKNAQKYIELSKNMLVESKREFIHDVEHEALVYFYESQLPKKTNEESILLIKKSIELTKSYKDKFFLDPSDFEIALFKKYLEAKNHVEAENLLKEIIKNTPKENEHRLFYLYTNYGNLISKSTQFKSAENFFKKAIMLYNFDSNSKNDLTQISIKDLKPFYSFESINGIVLAGNFYYERYTNTTDLIYLKTAQNLFFLASDMFYNLYLEDRYNENLFDTYKAIEKGLMAILEHQNSEIEITKTLEAIEKNVSKLTWSKFMYNKVKPNLNIPDSITTQENDLKTLINYYQNALYKNKTKHQLESDTLRYRISDLNLELKNLQEHIKLKYSNYYKRSNNAFSLSKFRESLPKNRLVLKYVLSNNQLYCFLISKSKLDFNHIKTNIDLKKAIINYTKKLSKFNSDYSADLALLKPIIYPILNVNKASNITIIPDDVLSYLPFETLILEPNFSTQKYSNISFSYASSLTLLKDQKTISFNYDDLKIGVFYSENSSNNELPSVSQETKNILNYFKGQSFNVTSKSSFFSDAKNFDILHLAMHSNIENINPEFSSLDFGKDQLLISELYNESLKASMAVLSACDTGHGTILNGEGIQSISKAFTYAGIPSTVMSLWKVDDEATAIIMTGFYKHLNEGEAKDEALKNAKLDYLNSTSEDALKHPYYWSGFILTGNTSPVVIKKTNYLYLRIASVCLILLLLYRKKLQFFK